MTRRRSSEARKRRKAKQEVKRRAARNVKKAKKAARKKMKKSLRPKKPSVMRMSEDKAFELIKRSRIPTPKQFFCKNEKNLNLALKKIGYPCIMKVVGKGIIHKSEYNGIEVIENEEQAIKTFKKMIRLKIVESILIQEKLSGLELIVGAKQDPNFGFIVSVGVGGKYTEIVKDVAFRICPITKDDAEKMVKELKIWDILSGLDENAKINFKELHEILVKISKFVVIRKIKEMDINPLFCRKDKCIAADIRIIEK